MLITNLAIAIIIIAVLIAVINAIILLCLTFQCKQNKFGWKELEEVPLENNETKEWEELKVLTAFKHA